MKNNLRVNSGYLKGKILKNPSKNSTRATKSIVKDCVFNVLRDELRRYVFIEAFGGSASMAIEAISNYAQKAYAIELDINAYKIACENANGLNIDIKNADTFVALPQILHSCKDKNIILYLDPPFDIRDGFSDIYLKIKMLFENSNADIVVIEHSSKIDFQSENFELFKYKKFGNTALSFFIKK